MAEFKEHTFCTVVLKSKSKTKIPSIYFFPQNPRREVERIMRYLDLSVSDEVISRILELTSFKKMKENPMTNYSCVPPPVFDQSISPFMRKGDYICSLTHAEAIVIY